VESTISLKKMVTSGAQHCNYGIEFNHSCSLTIPQPFNLQSLLVDMTKSTQHATLASHSCITKTVCINHTSMLLILFELYCMYTSDASRKVILHRISVMIPDSIINVISLLIQYITDQRNILSNTLNFLSHKGNGIKSQNS